MISWLALFTPLLTQALVIHFAKVITLELLMGSSMVECRACLSARFSMLWLTFLGAGYAYRKGTLISVDILLEHAGKKLARLLRIAIILCSALFAFILIKHGYDLMDRVASQTAPSTRVSMMWPYMAIPAGGVVIMINSLGLLLDEALNIHNQPKQEVN